MTLLAILFCLSSKNEHNAGNAEFERRYTSIIKHNLSKPPRGGFLMRHALNCYWYGPLYGIGRQYIY